MLVCRSVVSGQSRQISERKPRIVSGLAAILYFLIVLVLLLAAVINPDGNISGVPSLILTLPWSVAQFFASRYVWLSRFIIVFGGAMNAAVLYVCIKVIVRRFTLWITVGPLTVIGLLLTAAVWFINSAEVDNHIRIVNGGQEGGVYIATNEDGLRLLREMNGAAPGISDFGARDHLVFIPNKTKGRYKGWKFLLKGGRIVDPYPADTYDMVRDGAIEVERIKITEGPNKGLEGWVDSHFLQRV